MSIWDYFDKWGFGYGDNHPDAPDEYFKKKGGQPHKIGHGETRSSKCERYQHRSIQIQIDPKSNHYVDNMAGGRNKRILWGTGMV